MKFPVAIFCASLVCACSISDNAKAQTIGLQRVATGLDSPLFATAAPNDPNRLFIAERSGTIRAIDLTTDTLVSTPVISIPGLSTVGEQGLLGLAFDPDFATNGYFYVNANTPGGEFGNGVTNIIRYTMSGSPSTSLSADLGSATTIMTIDRPVTNHNGGWIGFSPKNDGYLYISSGDGGTANDPNNNAQNLNSPLGKILRIDPSREASPSVPYTIPSDNPFVGDAGARGEVWAYGVRNPFRASFDRLTGDFIMGDVGQGAFEEVNFQFAGSLGGENYGWRILEGTEPTPGINDPQSPDFDPTNPVFQIAHDGLSRSITGGYVYRGPDPEFFGKYIFGDFVTGQVWALNFDVSDPDLFNGNNISNLELISDRFLANLGSLDSIVSFGEDSLGNLYLVDFDGDVFRFGVTAVPEPSSLAIATIAAATWGAARWRRRKSKLG